MSKVPKKKALSLPTKNTKADDKVKGGMAKLPVSSVKAGNCNTNTLTCKATSVGCE